MFTRILKEGLTRSLVSVPLDPVQIEVLKGDPHDQWQAADDNDC